MGKGATPKPNNDRRRVFRAAVLWLLFLAPFFYLTYGPANWLASLRTAVPNLAFAWEVYVPFISWSVVPYWSINALYAVSLFVNNRPQDVGRLARRYLTAQIIAVICFVAFPLKAIFIRPETYGLPGLLFDILGGFDKPFNQAPSLHIALLVIIWDHWRKRFAGVLRTVWHIWCVLIGVSVLTTWQHHLMDIPTGLLLGLFALWLFPAGGPSPLARLRITTDAKARLLAIRYAGGAFTFLILTVMATFASGAGLLLLWPALALAVVALGYAGAGESVFQKGRDGQISLASKWLLLPFRLGVRMNILWWTRRLVPATEIANGVFLGRMPTKKEASNYSSIIDMTAELPGRATPAVDWQAFPSLDLLSVSTEQLQSATDAVENAHRRGAVLICCALGFQRSALVAAYWLVREGIAPDARASVTHIKASGRPVHLSERDICVVEATLKK